MGCGCGGKKATSNTGGPVIGPLRVAARRALPPRIEGFNIPSDAATSPAMEAERRRIEKIRREAVKRAFNR